jgi:hypothetical protein
MTALTPSPVRAKTPKQSAADRQAVYDFVTTRDKTCRAPVIEGAAAGNNGALAFRMALDCSRKLERHHAGNTIGSKRITSRRTVVLLCEFHHRTWAPTHSRLILEWLNRVENERADVVE